MTWTSLNFPFASQLTSTKMTQLQDNLTALANGDAGAPLIQAAAMDTDSVLAAAIAANAVGQSEISASAVGQSELKSTTASQSVSIPAASGSLSYQWGAAALSPTGGTYTLGWFIGGSTNYLYIFAGANSGTYSPTVEFRNSQTAGARTGYLYSRYFQASPPYNLGNGDIPIFVYLLVAKSGNTANIPAGKIMATSVSVDPAWAYNGPDHINPHNIYTGQDKKQYEIVRRMPWTKAEALADPIKLQENIAALANPQYDSVEIDMSRKLRNMPNVPHPFDGDVNLPHCDVVLVDPLSPLAMAAFELAREEDHATITEMLEFPGLVIDSAPISGLITPPGVIGVKATL